MLRLHKAMLIAILILHPAWANADRNELMAFERDTGATFLSPLRVHDKTIDVKATVSSMCDGAAGAIQCPESLVEAESPTNTEHLGILSAGSAGYSPTDDLAAELPSNLRVTFVLQQMENEVISGDGVALPRWALWETHSSVATEERLDDSVGLPAPGPGETWPIDHNNVIYDALVHDGCGNTPVFPVEFDSSVIEWDSTDISSEQVLIGEFSTFDDSTLQPNGFWNFSYIITAVGTNGGVSDFKFKGTVIATCTNLETFSASTGLNPSKLVQTQDAISSQSGPRSATTDFLAPSGDSTGVHCGGNTGRSCDPVIAACTADRGTSTCIPVQTPGGGTNGSYCSCKKSEN